MFSVISVVNDPAKARARLQAGLARQTARPEVILVDNQARQFAGGAAALNAGAARAHGDWLLFVHQDVELLTPDWLERAEAILNALPAAGWCGVVGRDTCGYWRGLLRDRAMVFGEPLDGPVEVQTLDECLLIRRRQEPGQAYFDEGVPGWHAYGVDACCTALRRGEKNYVLPLPVWHDSASSNRAGLREAHAYVWAKHRPAFRRIYTTVGVLPHPYGWSGSYKIAMLGRQLRDWRHLAWLRVADRHEAFRQTPWEVLEELTREEPVVECWHRRADYPEMEGTGFTDRTQAPRRVIHRFDGLERKTASSDCVVIAPDLASEITSRDKLPRGWRRLVICLYLGTPLAVPSYWQGLLRKPFHCRLAREADEKRWAILEVTPNSFKPSG